GKITGVINKYFENSYLDVVSTFVKNDKIQLEELKKLIEEIEHANNKKK
ncbi:MAG: transcriptional regulator, partial [Bacteroidetes bacterium HGW-Bacteroidetes-7]